MPLAGKEGNENRHSNLQFGKEASKTEKHCEEDICNVSSEEDPEKHSDSTKCTTEFVKVCWETADEYVNQIIKAQDADIDHNIKESDIECKEKVSKRNFYHKAEAEVRPDICYTSEEQPSEETNDYSDSNPKEEIRSESDPETTSCSSQKSTDTSLSYSQVYSEIYEESTRRQQRADRLCRVFNLNKFREEYSSGYPAEWAHRTEEDSEPYTDRSWSSETWSDVAHYRRATNVSIKPKVSGFMETFHSPDCGEQQKEQEEKTATNSSVDSADAPEDCNDQEPLRIISEYENKDALDSVRSSFGRSIDSDELEFDSEQIGESEGQTPQPSPRSLKDFHAGPSHCQISSQKDQKEISQAERSDREMTDDTSYPASSESSTRSTIHRSSLPRDNLCCGTRHHHQRHRRRPRRPKSVPKKYQDRGNSPINIKMARCSSNSEKVDSKTEGNQDCLITRSMASIGTQCQSDCEGNGPKTARSPLGLRIYNADEALMELPDTKGYVVMDENSCFLDLSASANEDQIRAKLLAAALTSTRSGNKRRRERITPNDDTCHRSIKNCMPSVIFKRRTEPVKDIFNKDRLYWIAESILRASEQRYQDIPMEYPISRGYDADRLHVDREIRGLEFNKRFQQQLRALEEIFH
ncbi:uncharacterized protein LOC117586296 [Drosophila guanche]|uniref:Blast:Dentin sialophosphoprotein n=1 Tax=Drosophila guanche TaxID=7266 RepID=A0A3B0KE65_DROGU|nr:uncharacterized protein LOC117586296 [Drosophila guanche]SPP84579.1 blast:Dentin sialophosphoprotein [Drosophila guanche]